jgi:hypothetical protein
MYRARYRRSRILSVVFLTVLLEVAPLYAFCPTNGVLCSLFATGISHETITTTAIRDLDAEFFAATHVTSSMRRAMNDIAAANAEVDDHQLLAHYHFDGETFADGKQRIVDLANDVVENLHGGDVKSARINLGGLLHTLQDFYAHSDFIEVGGRGAYPALWDPSQAISPLSGLLDSTCQACPYSVLLGYDCSHNVTTVAVTSGYFNPFLGGDSSKPLISTKCRHGGPLDFSIGPAGGINKDSVLPGDSPHWNLHLLAAASAQLATKDFLRHLRTQLTEQ